MSNTKEAGEITGKINPNPNPISFGQAHIVISWETDDPTNSEFEVLIANRYLAHKHLEDFKAAFSILENLKADVPSSIRWGGGSFWMRRKSAAG